MTVRMTKPQATLRELLAGLKKKTGLFGEQIIRAENAADFYNVIGTNRNLLINGDFNIWQRYTSTSSFNGWAGDRWQWVGGSTTGTLSKETSDLPPNQPFLSAARLVNTGSGTMIARQVIENGRAMYGTKGLYRTLSLWVKVISGNFSVDISDRAELPISKTSGWQRVSLTTSKDDGNAYDAHSYIDLQLNGVGEVIVTGVQYELGSVATPFEFRPYQQELALCQRYCIVYGNPTANQYVHLGIGAMYTGTATNITVALPVSMRATPTISKTVSSSLGNVWLHIYVGSSGFYSNSTPQLGETLSVGSNALRLYCPDSYSGGTAGQAAWCAIPNGAQLQLSAEL